MTLFAAMFNGLKMLWFVAGAIGIIELLRFVQERVSSFRRPWMQGLLFGVATGTVVALLFDALHMIDVKEIALIEPFLALLAGPQGAVIGGLVLATTLPQFAALSLSTAAAALLLLRWRKSPLFALLVGWIWIGVQGPIAGLLRGQWLHPAVDIVVSTLGAVALFVYVYEVDRRHRELLQAEHRSVTDPLTGLMSRYGLQTWLAAHSGAVGAVVMIDLDDFKPVNEIYGHEGGDAVLREASERMLGGMRPGDVLSRLGGDEFVAVIPGAGVKAAVAFSERLLRQMGQGDIAIGDGSVSVQASFGIAVGPLADSLAYADAALLRAKAGGKAQIVVFAESEPLRDEEGRLLRVTRFARDLIFRLPLGIVLTDKSWRVLAASPVYVKLCGLAEQDVLGQKPRRIVGSEITNATIFESVADTLDRGAPWQGEFLDRRPDGDLWWAAFAMAPIEVRNRRLGYMGIVYDNTESHRREAQILAESIAILSEQYDSSIYAHLRSTRDYMELLTEAWQSAQGRSELPYNPREYGMAALLHDVGKLAVPVEILTKPGPLTAREREIVNRHPEEGVRFIRQLHDRWGKGPASEYLQLFLDLASSLAFFHHERVSGDGYPRGVRGRDIPLHARLFSAVDVYDALQDLRPYKAAWPEEDAYAYLKERAGSDFDPQAVALIAEVRHLERWRAVREQAE